MYAAMEIDQSIFNSISEMLRTPSIMIYSSPTFRPASVTRAIVYTRNNHRVTLMERMSKGYVVVTSEDSVVPNTVLRDIKTTAQRIGGSCQILHGIEASEIASLAHNVHS